LFVVGAALIILGLGNYLRKLQSRSLSRTRVELAPQISQSQPFLLREEGKPFPSETWERWEIARAKLDYYYIVLSGGRLMISVAWCARYLRASMRRRRRNLR